MKYQLPIKYYLFVKELVLIRKGLHPTFKGDKRYNSEAVCFSFGRNYPLLAKEYANTLLKDSHYIDLPLSTLKVLSKELLKGANYSSQ